MAGPAPSSFKGRVVLVLAGLMVVAGIVWLLIARPEAAAPDAAGSNATDPAAASDSPAPTADPQPINFYLARADGARGETYFRNRCAACHTIDPGGRHVVGPNLHGVMGRPVGTRPGFTASPGLREAGGTWDWETLSRFLRAPRAFAPRTMMTFAGVTDPQNRADVMLYINGQGGTLQAPAGVPAAGVTRAFLTGRWGTNGCDPPAVVYAEDGSTGDGRRWSLDGDRLIVMQGMRQEQSVVERLDDDRMRLNTRDGPFELTRCPAPQR